jgi:hypothetical protein
LAIALSTLPAGAAGNPDRQFAPVPDVVIEFCDIAGRHVTGPILAQATINQEYAKTFTSRDGTVRIAFNGRLVDTFTRLETGQSVTFNASGPGTLTFYPDGNVTIVSRGLAVVGNPTGIWIYAGRLDIDPATGLVLPSSAGKQKADICALLS